ncbi:hypothetical protein P4S73_02825 [Paraglaciecola sp. Hal342]
MVKKQQMQWSPEGAHYLLQTRTAVLNGELRNHFEEWFPAMKPPAGISEGVAYGRLIFYILPHTLRCSPNWELTSQRRVGHDFGST